MAEPLEGEEKQEDRPAGQAQAESEDGAGSPVVSPVKLHALDSFNPFAATTASFELEAEDDDDDDFSTLQPATNPEDRARGDTQHPASSGAATSVCATPLPTQTSSKPSPTETSASSTPAATPAAGTERAKKTGSKKSRSQKGKKAADSQSEKRPKPTLDVKPGEAVYIKFRGFGDVYYPAIIIDAAEGRARIKYVEIFGETRSMVDQSHLSGEVCEGTATFSNIVTRRDPKIHSIKVSESAERMLADTVHTNPELIKELENIRPSLVAFLDVDSFLSAVNAHSSTLETLSSQRDGERYSQPSLIALPSLIRFFFCGEAERDRLKKEVQCGPLHLGDYAVLIDWIRKSMGEACETLLTHVERMRREEMRRAAREEAAEADARRLRAEAEQNAIADTGPPSSMTSTKSGASGKGTKRKAKAAGLSGSKRSKKKGRAANGSVPAPDGELDSARDDASMDPMSDATFAGDAGPVQSLSGGRGASERKLSVDQGSESKAHEGEASVQPRGDPMTAQFVNEGALNSNIPLSGTAMGDIPSPAPNPADAYPPSTFNTDVGESSMAGDVVNRDGDDRLESYNIFEMDALISDVVATEALLHLIMARLGVERSEAMWLYSRSEESFPEASRPVTVNGFTDDDMYELGQLRAARVNEPRRRSLYEIVEDEVEFV